MCTTVECSSMAISHAELIELGTNQFSTKFFLCLSIATCCKDVTCFTDYMNTLNCTCKGDFNSHEDASYQLVASWPTDDYDENEYQNEYDYQDVSDHKSARSQDHKTCNLTKSIDKDKSVEYTCTFILQCFHADLSLNISVLKIIDEKTVEHLESKEFVARDIIKLPAPFNLQVAFHNGYNISWEQQLNSLISKELQLELRFKKKTDPWENEKKLSVQEYCKHFILKQYLLSADTEYVAQVRVMPKSESSYKGAWSEWSPLVEWKTKPTDTPNKEGLLNMIWLLCIPSVLVIILLIHFCGSPRLCKLWPLLPNPAPFFKPLYALHNGDFKSWVQPPYMATFEFAENNIVCPAELEIHNQQDLQKKTFKSDLSFFDKHVSYPTVNCHSNCKSECLNANDSNSSMDRSYGHISIDTVTVANEVTPCCSQCNCNSVQGDHSYSTDQGCLDKDYPLTNFQDSSTSHMNNDLLTANLIRKDAIIPIGCVSINTKKHHETSDDLLENSLEEQVPMLDLRCLNIQPCSVLFLDHDEESVSYGEESLDSFQSNFRTGEEFGYPRICLDLDTIDSGFADSDCGSPVDSEFDNKGQTDPSYTNGQINLEEEEQYPRSYVKQWVTCNSATADEDCSKS
nr:PREDICTED: interleukin-21 receptor-like [Latimeria chalumnae]|eukprot:XP_006011703.2 PREDICTED: interleukin-21 receptor-like [Latimeria chalumnae]